MLNFSVVLFAVCCLLFAVCCFLFAVFCLPFSVCHFLFAVCCLLFAVCSLQFATCRLMFDVCCLQFRVCCLLFAACCLLFAVFCLLFAVNTTDPIWENLFLALWIIIQKCFEPSKLKWSCVWYAWAFGSLKMYFRDIWMILCDLVTLPKVGKHLVLSQYAISSRSNRPKSRK